MNHAGKMLVVAAALVAAACQSNRSQSTHETGAMPRPQLDAGWNWAGRALPTGRMDTSILTLEKMAPSELCAHTEYSYTIRVRNISNSVTAENVVVTDELPGGDVRYLGSEPRAERTRNGLRWAIGDMRPGSSETMSVRIGVGDSVSGDATCASATFGAPPAPPPPPAPEKPKPVLVAGLELSKTTPADTCLYDDIPIRLVVKNPGNGKATGVKVVDQLPDGWTVNGQKSVTFDVGDLAPGASKELSAKARSSRTGAFTNTASASGAGGLAATATSQTSVHKAVLEITKTSDRATAIIGRTATFTVTVKNTGDWVASNCTVRDTLTGADTIGAVSDGGTASGNTVTWNLGALQPGASRSMTVVAGRSSPGAIENTATASGGCSEPASANARCNFIGIPAVLLEVVDRPDPVLVGGTVTYTITVTNQGTAADSEIVITGEVESGVEIVSSAGKTTGTVQGSKVTFAALGSLAPKEEATWTVTVRGTKAADTRFRVALNTKETGRPVEETEATRFYE